MKNNKGYAAITATILMLVISLVTISAFTFFTLQEVNTNRAYVKSIDSHYISESGIEDAVYRITAQKLIGASQEIGVGDGTTTVTVTSSSNKRTIRSEGVRNSYQRNLQTTVDITTAAVSFYYGVQVGDGGIEMSNNSQVNGNVYSNGNIIGAPGTLITGDATVAGGLPASPTVQWTTHDADHPFASVSTNRDIAQSFIATAGGALPQVSVYLGKIGSPAGNITLRITNNNGNKPNSSDIANATIANGSVGSSPSWIDVSFSSPPTLVNGNTYWIVLDHGSDSATNHWNWRKDTSGGYTGNTGKYTSNWSSGGAVWTDIGADLAFRVWIGGTATKIQDMTIGNALLGTGRANLFVNTTIHGSSCPNAYCIVENPPRENLPISDGVIQDWKNAAVAGGVTSGDVIISGIVTLGPQKITGKLTVSNGSTLIVSGTLWVVGDIVFDNNSIIRLASSYGAVSGVIISDAKIDVKNNASVSGSGNPASFMMLLAAKDSTGEEIINVDNNSLGAIYYASKGWIKFSNNAAAKEATAHGIRLDNNAIITYDSGLASATFSSGPGGGFDIKQWEEVQ